MCTPAAAMTIEVPAGAPDTTATCSASPCPNLRSAIGLANGNPGSTIVLGAGSYPLSLGSLSIQATMSIGGVGPSATRILQTGAGRVLEAGPTGSLTLRGLEVRGGNVLSGSGFPEGGGIEFGSPTGTLTLTEVLVDHNRVEGDPGVKTKPGSLAAGGGIFDESGTVVIERSSIVQNVAVGGPGASNIGSNGGPGGIGFGGGIAVAGHLVVRESTISENVASGGSGGESNEHGGPGGQGSGGGLQTEEPATIVSSTIGDNTAAGGRGGDAPFLEGVNGRGGLASAGGLEMRAGGVVENTTITANAAQEGSPGTSPRPTEPALTPEAGGALMGGEATLASDTFAANVAPTGQGGNLVVLASGKLALRDTIIAAGSAASLDSCLQEGAIADEGHNLEDTAPSQCSLSAAEGDVIGLSPLLGPLAGNGGPTETLAPAPGSPALAAGGACTDPLAAGALLTLDQRGQPRSVPCDIGAFQHQPPASTAAPLIEGPGAVGRVLTCTTGSWTGEPPLSFAFAWLRDGAPIAGATGTSYLVADSDRGHGVSCQVTATNSYASTAARSASVAVPSSAPPATPGAHSATPPPVISHVRLSHSVWREGTRRAVLALAARRRPPLGTVIHFALNTRASIALNFTRSVAGRSVGGRCVARSTHNSHRRRCRLTVSVRVLAGTGHAGANRYSFYGRVGPTRKLATGSYALGITATNAAGTSRATGPSFTIVRG